MSIRSHVVIAAASALVLSASADRVTLKSGSFLTGEAGVIRDGSLEFASDDIGPVKIALANIVKLDSANKHVVQYLDGTCEEKALTVRDGAICEGDAKLDMSGVKATDPVPETWHGSVNVALNAARGNTEANSAAVVANVNRRWEKDRFAADFGYYYAESGKVHEDTERTTDRMEAELKHDHFWWSKVYHYEDLRFERDRIQDLNARYRLGVGGGYQWLDGVDFASSGKWSFNQELGVNYVKEDWEDNDDEAEDGFAAVRYAHALRYVPKWADTVEVFHDCEIVPDVDDYEKFLARADVGFSTKVMLDIDLLAKIEWDFNSQPADDRKKHDTRYIVGLGYKW